MCKPNPDHVNRLTNLQLTENTWASLAKPGPDQLNPTDLGLNECLMLHATEVCGSLLDSFLVAIGIWYTIIWHNLITILRIKLRNCHRHCGVLSRSYLKTWGYCKCEHLNHCWKLLSLEKSCLSPWHTRESPHSMSHRDSPHSMVDAVGEGLDTKSVTFASKWTTLRGQCITIHILPVILYLLPLIGIIPENTPH